LVRKSGRLKNNTTAFWTRLHTKTLQKIFRTENQRRLIVQHLTPLQCHKLRLERALLPFDGALELKQLRAKLPHYPANSISQAAQSQRRRRRACPKRNVVRCADRSQRTRRPNYSPSPVVPSPPCALPAARAPRRSRAFVSQTRKP